VIIITTIHKTVRQSPLRRFINTWQIFCNTFQSKKSSSGNTYIQMLKVKVIPQLAEVAQGVSCSLRPWIFLTFGTRRVVGRNSNAPASFTPGEIPGTHFQRLSWPQGTWFCRWEPRKKSPVTPPGIDPGTVRLVARCLNHYATPGPIQVSRFNKKGCWVVGWFVCIWDILRMRFLFYINHS